jgi:predicted nucleic acid-binding protein
VRICVDTTVLIDILRDEFPAVQDMLYKAIEKHEKLVVPAIVVAELMPQFSGDLNLLHMFLREHKIVIEPIDVDAVELAGERWMKYLLKKTKIKCNKCGTVLDKKEHVLSDFYIGGFALNNCDAIITRDRGIYKKYFQDLKAYENYL